MKRLVSRLYYLDGFLRICAWCKKLELEGEWIPPDGFFERKFQTETSHDTCQRCFDEMRAKERLPRCLAVQFKKLLLSTLVQPRLWRTNNLTDKCANEQKPRAPSCTVPSMTKDLTLEGQVQRALNGMWEKEQILFLLNVGKTTRAADYTIHFYDCGIRTAAVPLVKGQSLEQTVRAAVAGRVAKLSGLLTGHRPARN